MTRIQISCLLVSLGLLMATATAAAGDGAPLRSFSRFHLDSGTSDGLWAELGSSYVNNDDYGVDVDMVTVHAVIAYGNEYAEAGLYLPFHDLSVDIDGAGDHDENGIGDIELYGKVVPIRTELIDLGLGIDIFFPSGDEDEGLGAGETAFLPYFTTALHLGVVDLQSHVGYRFFTDEDMWEQIYYGFGLYAPIRDRVVLRTEFNALVQKAPGEDPDPWTFEPGVDIILPIDEEMTVLLRPTGLVAMNSDAPDWGVGGSVVLNWSPR